MKYRVSFVTNSSSGSFVVSKAKLTPLQIWLIHNHTQVAQQLAGAVECSFTQYCDNGDAWHITETDTTIGGSTFMTNFDMGDFFRFIGIDNNDVEWEGDEHF